MADKDYDNHYASEDEWHDPNDPESREQSELREQDEVHDRNVRDRPSRRGQRSGCGMKIFIALGVGFVLLCIAVCVGGYFFVQKIQDGMTTEPDKIRELTQAIVTVDVPPQVNPFMAVDLSMLGNSFSMAIYADQMGGSMWIMSVPAPYDPNVANVDDVLREMQEQQQHQQKGQKQKVITIEKRENIEKQVNGKLGKFLVAQGKDENGVPHIQVTAIFQSKRDNLGMFNLVISEQQMDLAAGRKLVESVK